MATSFVEAFLIGISSIHHHNGFIQIMVREDETVRSG
ncbi:MAG: hypothetical protein ETSY2_50620 [Candidatus Entotheonella gemina]|uniref:Uncharacterized protein n=1 Tax=Candidatus Entotheonella gemina TaxID=1429439 RepID=W4L7L1_9BACT|nr:MAG: hypothetical protein ETSY2_50620 [Candidatus Entotheonella gemina]